MLYLNRGASSLIDEGIGYAVGKELALPIAK
jgi:hypothetical protein